MTFSWSSQLNLIIRLADFRRKSPLTLYSLSGLSAVSRPWGTDTLNSHQLCLGFGVFCLCFAQAHRREVMVDVSWRRWTVRRYLIHSGVNQSAKKRTFLKGGWFIFLEKVCNFMCLELLVTRDCQAWEVFCSFIDDSTVVEANIDNIEGKELKQIETVKVKQMQKPHPTCISHYL